MYTAKSTETAVTCINYYHRIFGGRFFLFLLIERKESSPKILLRTKRTVPKMLRTKRTVPNNLFYLLTKLLGYSIISYTLLN
jgi:hypothetical protein